MTISSPCNVLVVVPLVGDVLGVATEVVVPAVVAPVSNAAAPFNPVAAVAITHTPPFVAMLVGLGPMENVVENAVAMFEHVAVADTYSSLACELPT